MPRVKKGPVPATPVTPPVPEAPVTTETVNETHVTPPVTKAVLKVKHKKSGKTFDVSRSYYLANQDKLDVVN